MTSHLSIAALTHRYGKREVLTNINLKAIEGEFLSFLGPSGCGKTTLLRAIAGFVAPSQGRIQLDGVNITDWPVHRRPINMVFQQSTLFPHLDVGGNIEFGLRVAKVPSATRREMVHDALDLVRLGGLASRRISELSGGELQRVNLARAVVNRPKVLLLDEPLASLDLRIRLELEVELRRVHREVGSTFIYVTHDQREALAISDRIAVFDHGRLEQLDDVRALYAKPVSAFAAKFVGDANTLAVDIVGGDRSSIVTVEGYRLPVERDELASGPYWLVVRPEDVRLDDASDRDNGSASDDGAAGWFPGVVADAAFRGASFTYRVECPEIGSSIKAEVPDNRPPLQVGDRIRVAWAPQRARLIQRDDSAPNDEAAAEIDGPPPGIRSNGGPTVDAGSAHAALPAGHR